MIIQITVENNHYWSYNFKNQKNHLNVNKKIQYCEITS